MYSCIIGCTKWQSQFIHPHLNVLYLLRFCPSNNRHIYMEMCFHGLRSCFTSREHRFQIYYLKTLNLKLHLPHQSERPNLLAMLTCIHTSYQYLPDYAAYCQACFFITDYQSLLSWHISSCLEALLPRSLPFSGHLFYIPGIQTKNLNSFLYSAAKNSYTFLHCVTSVDK